MGYLCPGFERPEHLSDDLTCDHIVPTSKGGEWYDPANIQVLCRSCNDRKARASGEARANA